ncbi:FAD/NAD(P)-binding domain-containing protein [Cyathus striatus]|nr:FAD/NAD(P)-binding domain-containing protein [Cyathus striatus]
MSSTKSIVIIGGGHAGTTLARLLSPKLSPEKYTLTLINPRPFSIWLPAMIRVSTSPQDELEEKALMPYTHLFQKTGTIVQGEVKSIKKDASGGSVVLENGEVIKFDILVLATGSIWEGPLHLANEKEEIDKALKRERDEVANAKSVVLVGGGAVGNEYAGEIKDIYPVRYGSNNCPWDSKLLNAAYPDKVRDKMADNVRARGVKLVLGEYIDSTETKDGVVTCRSGKTIPADLVIPTRGARPNTALFHALGEGTLTPTGQVKVNKHLQLPAFSDIFALGDIVDIKEQKQAAKVAGHAAVIADNILLALGERKGALKEYNVGAEMIVITNGKDGGVTYMGFLWGLLFGNWVTKTLKSKTLLVPMGRSAIGLKD